MAQKELDRFDTNAKADIKIKTKLVTLVGGFIILGCVVVAAVSLTVFDKKLVKNTQEGLVHTANGAQRVMEDWLVTLKTGAELIADAPEVQAALSGENNENALRSYIRAKAEALDMEAFAVLNKSGVVVPGGESNLTAGKNFVSIKGVARALNGTASLSFEAIDNIPFAAIAANPVKINGSVEGCIITIYDLTTDDFTNLMKKGYDVECTIFNGNTRVASTISGVVGTTLDNQEIVTKVLNNGDLFEGTNVIAGKNYYSVYQPLINADGYKAGMLFIAKSAEVVESVRKTTLIVVIPITIVLIAVLLTIAYIFINWLMWRISNVTNFLKELESGDADLTKRCKLFTRDEIGDLIIRFDAFLDKLQQIMRDVQSSKNELDSSGRDMTQSSEDTASAITQIIANIQDISNQISNQSGSVSQTANAVSDISDNIEQMEGLIESQSSSVSEASAAIEEMIGNISSVNQSVDKMARSFKDLSANAQTGFNKQQDVNERIKQIENQSEMLVEANQAISNIAEQTNLLAMNAAIEAAHAGEAGKGFSVVADEIRKLSETSSAQSKTIGEQLNNIKDSITEVVTASHESSEAFTAVSNKIRDTDELVLQIKAAMEEQNSGSQQIGQALKSMNDSTSDVSQSSKEMSARSDRIKMEMKNLQSVSTTMKNTMDEVSTGVRKIQESGDLLSTISKKVGGAINTIASQIDRFKV